MNGYKGIFGIIITAGGIGFSYIEQLTPLVRFVGLTLGVLTGFVILLIKIKELVNNDNRRISRKTK